MNRFFRQSGGLLKGAGLQDMVCNGHQQQLSEATPVWSLQGAGTPVDFKPLSTVVCVIWQTIERQYMQPMAAIHAAVW